MEVFTADMLLVYDLEKWKYTFISITGEMFCFM
jgi:hypothetical protein